MIKGERRAYLEENMETKANNYYLRSLNTPIGKLEGLRVARVEVWDRSEIAKDLKGIYKASSVEEVREKLKRFADRWGKRYPGVVKWREERAYELHAFMEFPKEIRSMIYTTNSIEGLFKELKKRLKAMEVLQGEESAD